MNDVDELDLEHLARISTAFGKRVIELAPNDVLFYDAASWQDAIVFVTAGEIELECSGGERHRFRRGDTLCLAPLRLDAVRNPGPVPAQLLAIWRRADQPADRRGHKSSRRST